MSYNQYQPQRFNLLPEVVKNLLIINGIFYLVTVVLGAKFDIDLTQYLGLHFPLSSDFKPYQVVTYMFMHGSFSHLFFNMFALWMFGNSIENHWGGKRFLIYYLVTGLGAALIHFVVLYFTQVMPDVAQIDAYSLVNEFSDKENLLHQYYNAIPPVVGASGAVFGLLLAFGMMFPNQMIYLYFAIPIKAKYFVILYGLFELFAGIANSAADNVAHFAHLGGMLFGFFLIKHWKRKNDFY